MCKSLASGDAGSISRPLTSHCLILALHSSGPKPPNASWRLQTEFSLSQAFLCWAHEPPQATCNPLAKIGATRQGPQTSPRRTTGPPTKRRAGLASPATGAAPSWPASGGGGSGGSTSRARSGARRSARGGGAGSASGAGPGSPCPSGAASQSDPPAPRRPARRCRSTRPTSMSISLSLGAPPSEPES